MALIRAHFRFLLVVVILAVSAFSAIAESAASEVIKFLPDAIGSFRADGAAQVIEAEKVNGGPTITASATRKYVRDDGLSFSIGLARAESESGAYALLTQVTGSDQKIEVDKIGTASSTSPGRIIFSRGSQVATIVWTDKSPAATEQIRAVITDFATTLPTSEDDVPPLVKHLPAGYTSAHPTYVVSQTGLKNLVAQPIIDVLAFDGGTEAVVASYGQAQVAIVEFTTPQMSIDNDSRIWTRIAELKSQGQSTPSAYRRVGNYSVFVFNAPDEKTANALVDQVKYEQVVQWLGDDPHLYDRMQKYFAQTSAGVLVAVLKSSGISLILCLGIGGLVGALLFRHRRAQSSAAFSDAGGSVRLDLDELTAPVNTRPLLPSPKRSHEDPTS